MTDELRSRSPALMLRTLPVVCHILDLQIVQYTNLMQAKRRHVGGCIYQSGKEELFSSGLLG